MKQFAEKVLIGIFAVFVAIAMVACAPAENEGSSQQPTDVAEPVEVDDSAETDEPTETEEVEETEETEEPMTEDPLDSSAWQLESLAGADLEADITLEFTEGVAGGSDGCNGYGANYTIDGTVIQFNTDGFASTLMACEEQIMADGTAYLEALRTAASFELAGEQLIIETKGGTLIFAPQGTDPDQVEGMDDSSVTSLENSRWTLLHTIVGGDAIVPAPFNSDVFMQFENGSVFGNAGCNNFNGSATIEGDTIDFGTLAATRKACDNERNQFESGMFELLEQVVRYEMDEINGVLRLIDGSDLIRAEFVAATIKTLYVGPETAECVGVGPQDCLLVKEDPNADYLFFYDTIVGFNYEPGFEYELLIAVSEKQDVPMDASSLRYTLIEEVAKTAIADTATLENTRWTLLHTVVGGDVFVVPPFDSDIFLTIENGTVAGNAGCNNFTGVAVIDGDQVTFGPLVSTRMACGGDRDTFENDLLVLLETIVRYEMDTETGTLRLYDEGDLLRAEFAASTVETLFVGAEKVECTGVAPQECYLVKNSAEADYEFFYDEIKGFSYEPGFEYELLVAITELPTAPMDASTLQYSLIEIISQTPTTE